MDTDIELIEAVQPKLDLCWRKLITSQIDEGMKIIYELFDDMEKIIGALSKNDNVDLTQIFNIFEKLEKAMKLPDYILMGDILKYGISPLLFQWKNQLG